jgi:hypothetical protein
MQPEKKQLEIVLINYFRESLGTFPKGQLEPAESPDFILSLKNRHKIGIELTRLNPMNINPKDEFQRKINRERDHIIELIRSIFENELSHKLFVKFLFSDDVIESERQIMVAVNTAGLIRKLLKNKSAGSFFHVSLYKTELPKGIEEILIVGHPAMEVSIWERANNLGISTDVVDDIKKAIQKKDEKLLRLYQKQRLNYYWLLITTDRLQGVKSYNLPEKVMNHSFHSNFQRVFLFDLIKSAVFELV